MIDILPTQRRSRSSTSKSTDRIQARETVPTPAVRASRDDGYEVDVNAAVLGYTADDQPVGIVSDDQRVRTTARGLGASVTGTVGVVVRAVEVGFDREEAYDLIQQIDSHGLHMTGSPREADTELTDEAAHSTS